MSDPEIGWTSPEVREEFPELRLWSMAVAARPGRTTPGLRERLRVLSNRFGGARAIALRSDPIPQAYRVFFRQVGLDPDDERVPVEAVVLERLMHGGFESRNLLEDALLVAVVETGVPLWALDDERIDGPLGIRLAGDREQLGRGELAPAVRAGRMVVADAESPLAELFGQIGPGHGVNPDTTAIRLFSVQPPGVPSIHVEEAMWTATEALDST